MVIDRCSHRGLLNKKGAQGVAQGVASITLALGKICQIGKVNNYLFNGNKVRLFFTEVNSRNFIARATGNNTGNDRFESSSR